MKVWIGWLVMVLAVVAGAQAQDVDYAHPGHRVAFTTVATTGTAMLSHEAFRNAAAATKPGYFHLGWGAGAIGGAAVGAFLPHRYIGGVQTRKALRAHCETLPPFEPRTRCRRLIERHPDRGALLREWTAIAAR